MEVELREQIDPRSAETAQPSCRFCAAPLRHTFVDLGMSPLCESYVPAERLGAMEPFYPLHVRICERCLLVQLEELVAPEEIFTEYAYFSSYSDSWVAHARDFVESAVERFGLDADSLVVELASNDGYLLQHVVERGIPALGVEPAANVAAAARERGIETVVAFFGREQAARLAAEGRRADLLVANNVLAHVPDLNDFVGGIERVLAPEGVVTIEFPHLARLIEDNQFDTIYHEHFSYFSFLTARAVLAAHGLEVFDVDELPTHGGSLRVYAQRADLTLAGPRARGWRSWPSASGRSGSTGSRGTATFAPRVMETKWKLLEFLIECRRDGKRVAGYGAPGKGNTLLNYCGIRDRPARVHGRPQPVQAGAVPAGHPHPDPPSRGARAGPSRLHPDPSLEPQGGDRGPARPRAEWGARFVVPIPEVEVL